MNWINPETPSSLADGHVPLSGACVYVHGPTPQPWKQNISGTYQISALLSGFLEEFGCLVFGLFWCFVWWLFLVILGWGFFWGGEGGVAIF